MAEGLRIGEFAEHTGLSVRSIRFYHQVGILQRPRVRGRTGYYGQEHVERVDMVKRLQAKGYSLAAIADSIATQVPSILLGEVTGMDPATAVWDGADPSKVTRSQLVAMVPALADDPALLQRLTALGLLVPEDGERFTVPEPPLLRAGIVLVSRHVPVAVALDELEHLRHVLAGIADRFAGIVERDMLPAQQLAGRATGDLAVDLLRHVWPAVLVAVGQVLTDATHAAVLARLAPAATPVEVAPEEFRD
jgi:DNA-binding transcriptional MerR regulator